MIYLAHLTAHASTVGAVHATLAQLARDTAREEGALAYWFRQDELDPRKFTVFERYRDQAAFITHINATYVQAAYASFEELLVEPPRMSRSVDGVS
jgi:quinol monooxygenase YgiN